MKHLLCGRREVIIVARSHNSTLSWEALVSFLKLDLFPFNAIKAVAPLASKEAKINWLNMRSMQVKGEKVYFNDWQPTCNRINLQETAWFLIHITGRLILGVRLGLKWVIFSRWMKLRCLGVI